MIIPLREKNPTIDKDMKKKEKAQKKISDNSMYHDIFMLTAKL